MKILVTGALGFIGSNLTERLVNEGHTVSALDNLNTGSEDNIEKIKNKIKIFVLDAGYIEKTGEKYDVIFHNGIYSSSPMYKKNPHLTAKVLQEWINILEYARKNNTKVIFASTSSLYNGHKPPHKEVMIPFTTDFYSETRIAMERIARLYNEFYSMPIIGLRYFSVYGPHEKAKQNYANLITQFLWKMKTNEAPVIFGDGTQTRDFTYVDDIVEANILSLKYKNFGIFNIGTGTSTTLNDMVKLLNKKLNTNLQPLYEPNKIKNYVQHTMADTSKAEKELGFKAKINLEQGIEKLIQYY